MPGEDGQVEGEQLQRYDVQNGLQTVDGRRNGQHFVRVTDHFLVALVTDHNRTSAARGHLVHSVHVLLHTATQRYRDTCRQMGRI